jgi:hypothetical protein
MSYEELKDGTLTVMSQVNDTFRIIMKENATHCNIKVIELSPYVGVFQTLLVIKDFKDPLADDPSRKKQSSYHSLE